MMPPDGQDRFQVVFQAIQQSCALRSRHPSQHANQGSADGRKWRLSPDQVEAGPVQRPNALALRAHLHLLHEARLADPGVASHGDERQAFRGSR